MHFFLLIYSFLITVLTFRNKIKEINIIGGIKAKRGVRIKQNHNTKNITLNEIFEYYKFDPDKVWTRPSRALSKILFIICYLGITSLGAISISSASIVYIIKSQVQAPTPHQPDKILLNFAIILNGDVHYTREILEGFRNEVTSSLSESIYKPHFEVTVGSPSANDTVTNKKALDSLFTLFDNKPDYLVTIGTNISEYVFKKYFNKIPIVFIAVTDPIKSGLVKSFSSDEARGNICGFKYGLPVEVYLNFFNRAFPRKTIGFIYNPNFHQDVYLKDELLEEQKNHQRTVKIIPVETSNSFLNSKQEQIADIFWGRFALSTQFQNFIKNSNKPFIVNSPLNTERGAIASMSVDDELMGKMAVDKIILPNLLNGKSLNSIPIQQIVDPTISINLRAARKYGVSISQDVVKTADIVIN